jgi:serine protease Do
VKAVSYIFFLLSSFIWADIVSTEAWNKKSPENKSDLISIQKRLNLLLPEVQKALVSIEAGDGAGSGIIVSEDGLVLSAAHVIGNTGKKMRVRLPNGKSAPAITLGGSEISDAGMLKITQKGPWPYIDIAAKNKSEIGDWCFGLGHPGGFDEKRGIVVRIGRIIAKKNETVQTDSRLLGGDSGGPLFNFDGKLIAIHSRVSQKPDQNFHVPIEAFHANWAFFKEKPLVTYETMQEGGFFGVSCEETESGIMIREVYEGTAAEKAGMSINDILLEVNNEPLDSREEFIILISSLEPGQEANILYQRNGSQSAVKVKLGVRPEDDQ